ncbi:hypothetical protein SEVIR_7G026200v4 [Setaria viridis]|uniref:F-box domain-containing protein n=1 Tax=Setaria viridis TaxID=4556 RepID=A0A4U6U0E6_SETVI|nr:FBD-associated F-box protein At5g56370-like [Setaria viridis]TKW03467.1 hypothetical protein SEVIR_7G026200v2 [Setaria viridis]
MANQNQEFVHIDDRTAADMRRKGFDPHEMEQSTQMILYYLYTSLPAPPVSAASRLSALRAPSDVVDRISHLPFALLRDIVSRLPVKDAMRTAAISRRWRPVWRCSPLVFADAHLIPGAIEGRRQPVRADTPGLVPAVTRVLAAHPGPFRSVHLVCGYMDAHQRQLARWIQTLIDKGVSELVLVNRPWPLEVPLPAALFGISTLTRLYLGIWKFPDTSGLRRGAGAEATFPHLRDLVLSAVLIENRDLDFVLAGSPALETLGIQGSKNGVRLRLVGQHIRCVQICMCYVESIAVVDTPNLERLLVWGSMTRGGSCIRVKIGNAPKLSLLGYLEPGIHMLEIRNTVITAGVRASPSTMAPSVKILGLHVRFGVRNDVKMLPIFLKCFPNVETLHIMSARTDEVTGKLNLKFWQEVGHIESIRSCIKAMTFREFQGVRSEVAFLKFVFQSAQALKKAVIVSAKGSFTSIGEAISKVRSLTPDNWASNCSVFVYEGSGPEGGGLWNFRKGCDFSVSDPFAYH